MAKGNVKPPKTSEYKAAEKEAFDEVWSDVPEVVAKSDKSPEAKRKQMIAISLSKTKAKVSKKGK